MKTSKKIFISNSVILLSALFILSFSFQNCGGNFQTTNQENSQSNLASGPEPTLSAVLAWDKSSSSNIQGYRIYLGTSATTYDKVIDVGATYNPDQPQYEVVNLDPQSVYYAVVTAYDTLGRESAASSAVTVSSK